MHVWLASLQKEERYLFPSLPAITTTLPTKQVQVSRPEHAPRPDGLHSEVADRAEACYERFNAPLGADTLASPYDVHSNDIADRVVLPLHDQRCRIHHLGVPIIRHSAKPKRNSMSGIEVGKGNSGITPISSRTFSSHQGGRSAHICPAHSWLIIA